jgi:hypothetical protein
MPGLTLTYQGLSISLTRFDGTSWPRTRIDTPELSRTAYNTPIERGTSYEPPHIWQVSALVSDARATASDFSDMDTLEAMFNTWQIAGGDLVLHDYTRDFSEAAPQTRALATGGTVRTSGTIVRYPAQFNVRFSGDLKIDRQTSTGTMVKATFQLVETTKRLAPPPP